MKTQICRNLVVLVVISVLLLGMTYLGQAAPQPSSSAIILMDELKQETRGTVWDLATEVPIFFDDFSNPSSGWPHQVTVEDCYFEYSGGHYRVEVSRNGQRCLIPNLRIPKQINGAFSVKVRRTSPQDRHLLYGLIFGAGTSATQNRWTLEAYPNDDSACSNKPFYWLYALVDGNQEFFEEFCTASIDKDVNDWNELKVIRSGKNIDVYINGQRTGDYSDADYLLNEGYSLLEVVSTSNDTIEVEFDDFTVLSDTGASPQGHTIYLPLSVKNYSPPRPTPTPTRPPTPPPSSCPQAGAWSGTTNQGYPISFTVSNTPSCQVRPLQITMYISCFGPPPVPPPGRLMTIGIDGAIPISNNHFSISGYPKVIGDFTSPTTARGTWEYFEAWCSGNGTWTANH